MDYIFVPTDFIDPLTTEDIEIKEPELDLVSETGSNSESQTDLLNETEVTNSVPTETTPDEPVGDKTISINDNTPLKIKKADIMQYQMGSDHCPIYIEFKLPLAQPQHPPTKLSSDTMKAQKVSDPILI